MNGVKRQHQTWHILFSGTWGFHLAEPMCFRRQIKLKKKEFSLKISGIYCIQSNIHPDRIYIGSSTNIKRRFFEHKNRLNRGNHPNSKILRHVVKYGISDLDFFVVMECANESLIENEQFYLDILNPYFNIRKIANSNLGFKHSDKTKEQMSKSMTGIKRSDDNKLKISVISKKRWKDEEYRNKMILIYKDRRVSDETKQKLSDTHKKKWEDVEYREKYIRNLIEYNKTEESKEKRRIKQYENWNNKDYRRRCTYGVIKQWESKEKRDEFSLVMTERWKDNEYRDMVLKSTQNKREQKGKTFGKSKFWGVIFVCKNKKWRSFVKINNKTITFGMYDNEIEAAIAREHFILLNGIENITKNLISSTGEPRYDKEQAD